MSRRRAIAVLGSITIAGCTAPAPEPTPPPAAPPSPIIVPPAPPPPVISEPAYENWLDAPQTRGDWSYTSGTRSSVARFGDQFRISCDKTTDRVSLVRSGFSSRTVPMRIRTETASRILDATPGSNDPGDLWATIEAGDSLLRAIAFSRGRFSVETEGMRTLYLPAWPEITRVVEDCL